MVDVINSQIFLKLFGAIKGRSIFSRIFNLFKDILKISTTFIVFKGERHASSF
jgi:hypothetical protein